ncbi:MAG: UbiD family decarboxylase [Thermodesulfobacteriota bacterium]|nr:UbiD family decarboxylase [Thermodesulfobacteriota bacterium]
MAYKDLREWIDRLDIEGDLQKIDVEVDWNLELGAIIRRSYDLKEKAPFFQKIKDYPEGYRILGAPAGTSKNPNYQFTRIATSFDMKKDAKAQEIIEEYLKRKKYPKKPVIVKDGVCKENIHLGKDVDLNKLPAPLLHEGDGGRYIGTWHLQITKDPEKNWVNWGMYRLMVHGKDSMGGIIDPAKHIGEMYFQKYKPKNLPMECAVAIGTEPVSPIIACTFLPSGVNEVDIAGGIRNEPVELVKCETVDLFVPSSSEIVIEGEVLPDLTKPEGPFGEYTGYRAGVTSPKPVFKVKAITHRNNPILTVSCMGVPVDDCAAVMSITMAAEILEELRNKRLPVKMVFCPPEAVTHMAVVSTKVPYPNFPKKIAHSIWGSTAGMYLYWIVVVEDDVDVTKMEEVLHTITTRCHPYNGVSKIKDAPAAAFLLPFLPPEERLKGKGAYILFDCTWPLDWPENAIPKKASFDILWPEEIQHKVLKNWGKYGYKV